MYDNISSLKFSKGANNEMLATAMISGEGEVMDFHRPVPADGRVEDWMTRVLNEMRHTNRLITKEAIFYYYANNIPRYKNVHISRHKNKEQVCIKNVKNGMKEATFYYYANNITRSVHF